MKPIAKWAADRVLAESGEMKKRRVTLLSKLKAIRRKLASAVRTLVNPSDVVDAMLLINDLDKLRQKLASGTGLAPHVLDRELMGILGRLSQRVRRFLIDIDR
jgi:hypothetical protein